MVRILVVTVEGAGHPHPVLHTENPPLAALKSFFTDATGGSGTYGHLLLEQSTAPFQDAIVDALRPYFESAHADAREHFHKAVRISLHPEAGEMGADATYPNCLPPKTIRGLFGEVMAGMIAEAYPMVGTKSWRIPIFLFRGHGAAEDYIFDLARDPTKKREVHGRPGNDFIGLEMAADGTVTAFIAGEAKWRADLTASTMDTIMKGDGTGKGPARVYKDNGVWNDINTALPVPKGLQQMCDLLAIKDRDAFARTILSLDEALLGKSSPPRTDLVLVAGNRSPKRPKGATLLPTAAAPADYKATRPLQIVEIVLEGGEDLIKRIYTSLWVKHGGT